ncbi:hypothetical protein BB934_45190 (plasmid) [Microvirga ossetica]|uniref:Chemotaxis methyl-accepting receptor Tar-related ligand-binding domain-containing protein n=1 Tax=Microvirga ossetica TaxID=1882682 RepID=A0A1B2EZQ7_9HYPH|nr:Tar ligand binding domain-containing protein [Microvirga ossetica]ANY85417.1 hypothetical protein BB934_45190 [Microvirga ossetica]
MSFKNVSIRTKLIGTASMLFMAVVVVGGVGWYASSVANRGLQAVYRDRVVPLRDLKGISDLYAVNIVDTAHKVQDGALTWEAGLERVNEAQANVSRLWGDYLKTHMEADERALADKSQKQREVTKPAVADLAGIMQAKDREAHDRFVIDRLNPAMDPILETVSQLATIQTDETRKEYERSEATYHRAQMWSVVAFTGAFVALLLALWVKVFQVVNPIKGMTAIMKRLAGGDYRATIPGLGRNVQEAASGTESVTGGIGSVRQGAGETGEAASQVLTAAQGLSLNSDDLGHAVSAFLSEVRTA